MKRPYLNQKQRLEIKLDTILGAHLLLNLAVQKLRRDVYNSKGYFAMRKAEKHIVAFVNRKLFNHG